jgi:hypothetical protein
VKDTPRHARLHLLDPVAAFGVFAQVAGRLLPWVGRVGAARQRCYVFLTTEGQLDWAAEKVVVNKKQGMLLGAVDILRPRNGERRLAFRGWAFRDMEDEIRDIAAQAGFAPVFKP